MKTNHPLLKLTPPQLEILAREQGWEVEEIDGQKRILAFGETFRLCHPWAVYSKTYRDATNPETKYIAMKAMHDLLWPKRIKTWNYWIERCFRAHCENRSFVSLAGGASTGKSANAAVVALLCWLSDPQNNAVIVASTTLQSLSKRIWGYCVRLVFEAEKNIPLQFKYTKSPTPQIVFDSKDEIHSMTAMAAGMGTDEDAIKNYIGRHPNKKFMLILDEATDLSPFILKAVANLEAGKTGKLQTWVIGNSYSTGDLHGALSTPKNGWDSIDPLRDVLWETTQPNGICLYFSPYESPAIHEPDPERRELFEEFFITEKQIKEKELKMGKDSVEFHRMVLGFWQQNTGRERTFTTRPFLNLHDVGLRSIWSGLQPLKKIAGFDPSFSTGGDKAILRVGVLGQEESGRTVIDFRESSLLYELKMSAVHKNPIDVQLADQLIDLLVMHNMALHECTFDVSGQGRTFPELVRSRAALRGINWLSPPKIWHARSSSQKNNQDVLVKSPTELWDMAKAFIQSKQIRGMDSMSIYQMTNRQEIVNPKTGRREIEPKLDFKNRMAAINPGMGGSPDHADALCLCIFSAVYNSGFGLEDTRVNIPEPKNWMEEKMDLYKIAKLMHHAGYQEMRGLTPEGPIVEEKTGVVLKATFMSELVPKGYK